MKLPALLGILLTVGAFAAASKLRPQGRPYSAKMAERRARAAKICAAQGPTCHLQERPGQPRDLTGAGCVCD
jgi:hypothetical protein